MFAHTDPEMHWLLIGAVTVFWTRRLFKCTELSLTGSSKFAKCNTDPPSCLVMLLSVFSFYLVLSFASVVSVSESSGMGG